MSGSVSAEMSLDDIKNKVLATVPNLNIEKVEPTETKDIYKVYVEGRGHLIFVNEELMIVGDFYRIGEQLSINEQIQAQDALAAIQSVDPDTLINFGPEDAPLHVTMFTDIDCGYCRKVQEEMDQYEAEGIRISEILFPRTGPNTESWEKAEIVWCADDKKAAIVKLKKDEEVEKKECDTSGLATHYQAGLDAGLVGTPLFIADDGTIIQGYVPAKTMAARLTAIKEASDTAAN